LRNDVLGGEVDERASLCEQGLDAPPLAYDHLELGRPCHDLVAREVDQGRAAIADSLYLGRSVQDVPIRRAAAAKPWIRPQIAQSWTICAVESPL